MVELRARISYHGGDADRGMLNIYDAGVSLHGLSRSLAITGHAFLNDGAVRRRAERAAGVSIYVLPSRHGSFEQIISIVLENPAAAGIGVSVAAAAFWDFLKWSWSNTIGVLFEPVTPHVLRLRERREPFIGEMTEALERPLELMHRPIAAEPEMQILVSRPRVGEVIRLNRESLDQVSSRTENDHPVEVQGNVTRYNVLTGYGRLYDRELEATIGFKVSEEVSGVEKECLTWSLHEYNRDQGGRLVFTVNRVVNARGEPKRYLVTAIRPWRIPLRATEPESPDY